MTDEEKKFLEKHFKAGEYGILQILVRTEDINKLISILKTANLNLAIMPSTQAKIDFASDDFDKKEH